MKLLLDECIPKRLRVDFPGHEVLPVDQNLPFQQNLTAQSIAILILVGRSNRCPELRALVPKALEALLMIKPVDVSRIKS